MLTQIDPRLNNTNLAFNVIAVGGQELGQLVETCEVIVKVWRIWSGPVKACDDRKKKEGLLHLDSKFWPTDNADQPGAGLNIFIAIKIKVQLILDFIIYFLFT